MFKFGKLCLVNWYYMKPCDQQNIDMSRCDLVAALKDHKWKTASLQESGVDCMFFTFCIYYYLLNA